MQKVRKVSIMGLPGVGKSTLVKMLTNQKIPRNYVPTVALGFGDAQIGEYKVSLWDLGGQDQFRFMWDSFLPVSNTILLVTDSTRAGVQKTKELVNKYSNFNGSKLMVIANKQDLPNTLSPELCEKFLSSEKRIIKTYDMIAIEPMYREKILAIIKEAIKQVS